MRDSVQHDGALRAADQQDGAPIALANADPISHAAQERRPSMGSEGLGRKRFDLADQRVTVTPAEQ
jgi:hypothetical protein